MKPLKLLLLTFLLALGIGMASPARSQSIPQLIEQLVLDKQKLAELKMILQDMYKAYEIINKGYTDVKNIVHGNFDLHKAYLDGLLAISPAVRDYYRVAAVLNTESNILSEYKAASARFAHDGNFTIQELDYMNNVYAALLTRSTNAISELTMVTTANELRMSDAERLRAIDLVYNDLTGDLTFLRTFNNSTSLQAVQRAKERGDINTLKSIYGISN